MSPFALNIVKQFPPDLLEAFEERCAIMEFDGKMPRHLAEHRAFLNYVDDMTGQHYLDSVSIQSAMKF